MTSAGFTYSEPGFTDDRQSIENDIFFQTAFIGSPVLDPLGEIDSTAVDSTHTNTTQLRAGLVMAKLTSGGNWVDYDPTANDGSQIACGVLCREVYLLDPSTASSTSRRGLIAVAGNFKAAGSNLIGLDAMARSALKKQGFVFDDAPTVVADAGQEYVGPKYVTADTTLTSSDSGKLIVSNGSALTHTLPTLANGLVIDIMNIHDSAFTVSSAAGNDIIAVNDVAASTVAASTGNQKIGARFKFVATYINGTLKWVFSNKSPGVVTVSVT